jgi:hypothetical protein
MRIIGCILFQICPQPFQTLMKNGWLYCTIVQRVFTMRTTLFSQFPRVYMCIPYGKEVNTRFKSKFQGKVWAAATAYTEPDFKKAFTENSVMNQEAATYLSLWARSAFPVPPYGSVTSNSAESLNSWMEPLQTGLHLNALVKCKWFHKLLNYF